MHKFVYFWTRLRDSFSRDSQPLLNLDVLIMASDEVASSSSSRPSLSRDLRASSRAAHDVSDALVNVKLGVAMTEDEVWAEGLLVFAEVFRYLEEAVKRNDAALGHYGEIQGLLGRAAAFEADLTHFYGQNWRSQHGEPRPEVLTYLNYLKQCEEEARDGRYDPDHIDFL